MSLLEQPQHGTMASKRSRLQKHYSQTVSIGNEDALYQLYVACLQPRLKHHGKEDRIRQDTSSH